MNSLKNTIVAILLLGVSYGVYQVLTKSDSKSLTTAEFHALSEPTIEMPENAPPAPLGEAALSNEALTQPAPPPLAAPPVAAPAAKPVESLLGPPSAPPSTSESAPAKAAPWSTRPLENPLPASQPPSGPTFGSSTPAPFPAFGSGPAATSASAAPTFGSSPAASPAGQAAPLQATQLSATPLAELGAPANSRPFGGESSVESNIPTQPAPGAVGLTAGTVPLPTLESSFQTARQLIAAGQMRQALAELTSQLHNPDLMQEDTTTLYKWLDTLAGKVIYSTEHHVSSQPHLVQPNETLASLADAWRVPQQLVYNINREKISNPFELAPGTELKKVGGPFRAELDLRTQMVTLFLDELYAGRFRCVSLAPDLQAGSWRVENKLESGHPSGQFLVQTGNPVVSLHAQPAAGTPTGCCFTQSDARDLFSILSVGSEIKIIR